MTLIRHKLLKEVPLQALLLETLLIVLAILLALAVDNWRESRASAHLVETVLETIRGELERNLGFLEKRLPYHEAMEQAMIAAGETFFVEEDGRYRLRDPERIPSREDVGMRRGTGLALSPRLSGNAWQAALTSGALTHLDYSLLYRLSVAYTTLEEVTLDAERVLDGLTRFDRAYLEGELPLASLVEFQTSMADLVLRERQLKSQSEELLALIAGQ